MDFAEVYSFLFESYAGIGILVGAGLVISIIVCVILEVRTRKVFKNHEPSENDGWSIFDDDDEDEAAMPAKKAAAGSGKKLNAKAVTGQTSASKVVNVTPKKVVKKQ